MSSERVDKLCLSFCYLYKDLVLPGLYVFKVCDIFSRYSQRKEIETGTGGGKLADRLAARLAGRPETRLARNLAALLDSGLSTSGQ